MDEQETLKALLVLFGLLIGGDALFWALRPGGILRRESVLDNWSVLVKKGKGKTEC